MDNNSFLSRWSKRKLEEQHEAEVDPASPAEHSSGSETGAADVDSGTRTNELHSSDSVLADGVDSQTDAKAEAGDSTEETTTEDSTNEQPQSVAALLASEASQQVKKAALRKLFLSGEFSEVDRLNDYDHDYSKVKSLSTEVAQGLREWLNKADDKPEDEPGSEAQDVHSESDVSRVESGAAASGNDLVDQDTDVEAVNVNVNGDVNINGMSGKEETALDGKLAASAQSETGPEYRVDNLDDGTKSTT